MSSHLPHQPLFEQSNIIAYKWPQIYVPRISLARYVVEKFLFYANQIFVIDGHTKSQFTYKHVLVDSLKTARILRSNHVTASSIVAIVGSNSYENVCTFFAACLLDATIVLIDANASKEQISAAVRHCGIDYLAVVRSKSGRQDFTRLAVLAQQYKKPYLMTFGDSSTDDLADCLEGMPSYTVFEESPINAKYLGLQRVNNQNNWNRTRIIIPTFRGSKVLKTYSISEHSLLSQLTYATLAQSGFEWNINDIVLNLWPFSHLLGIFELLVTFSVGARLVLHRHHRRIGTDELAKLIENHLITACLLHSAYLLDLIKSQVSLGSLEKVLYTEQAIHRNIVSVFRKKFAIHNCRYGFFLLEASGFAAIEVLNYADNTVVSVTPLPSMEILVVNRETGMANRHGQLGKILIRAPYCASTNSRRRKDGWLFSNHVGYYDGTTYLQVIDRYSNFIKSGQSFISKTLVETVLLSHPSVVRAVAMKNPLSKPSNEFQAYVTLKDGHSYSETTLSDYLNAYLSDNLMKWNVNAVERLPRTGLHRIVTRRLRKVNGQVAVGTSNGLKTSAI